MKTSFTSRLHVDREVALRHPMVLGGTHGKITYLDVVRRAPAGCLAQIKICGGWFLCQSAEVRFPYHFGLILAIRSGEIHFESARVLNKDESGFCSSVRVTVVGGKRGGKTSDPRGR